MMNGKFVKMTKYFLSFFLIVLMLLSMTGCVDQSGGGESKDTGIQGDVKTMLEISDPQEKAAVESAKKK